MFDATRMKNIVNTLLMLASTILCGCSSELHSVEDFQKHYTATRWYWAKYQLDPADSTLSAFNVTDNQGMQLFLVSTSGMDLTYSELAPSHGIKSFRGNGTLIALSGVSEPIFEVDSDYTRRNPNRVLLLGFVGNRAFQIEARQSNTNRADVLTAAVNFARQMHGHILAKQSKDVSTSNKPPDATSQ
jgi:hypothetical protein